MATFTMYFKNALDADPSLHDVMASYPIFDEGYRERLNGLMMDRFWNLEIGQETVSMFKLAFRRKLNEVMPFYNEQYKASALQAKLDPLQTMKMDNESENDTVASSTGKQESESNTTAKSRGVASDFPQTHLSGNGDYASTSQDNNSATVAAGKTGEESENKQTGKNKSKVRASQGQTSRLILQHRQSLVNVDTMLLDDLEESLFMGITSSGDEFTEGVGYIGYGTGYGNIFGGIW